MKRAEVVDASSAARVIVQGPDARAFLHRLSTQHVKDLQAGDGRLNALLTDKGRLKDVVLHLDRGERGVLLVGSAGRGPDILAWLDRYLFTEKVELADLSSTGSAAFVGGPGAGAVVDRVVPGASALPPWGFVEAGPRLAARGFDRLDDAGARVSGFVVVDLEAPGVAAALAAAGASLVDEAAAEEARVAAGVPGPAEITDAHTPLDLGLHDAIHWAKGCYIGQEVIARLDTYQKQHKRLVVVEAEAPLPPRGALRVDGTVAGTLTSAAGARALAVARLPADGPVHVVDGETDVAGRAHAPATAQLPHD